MKVVFDTNIFISAFVIPGSKGEKAYHNAIKGTFRLYTSIIILTETAERLRKKFGWRDQRIIRLLKSIDKHLLNLKDYKDIRIVMLADFLNIIEANP